MPPRRRKPSSEPELEPEHQSELLSPSFAEDREAPLPFFNTTFSTHRASPLYVGANALSFSRLQTLSQRLRDTLVGDVVRGVQVGLEGNDSSLGRAGPLEKVGIRWVSVDALLGGADDAEADPSQDISSDAVGGDSERKPRALVFEMRYENALCTAMLLPSQPKDVARQIETNSTNQLGIPGLLTSGSSAGDGHFLHLPLLLLRMPAPLKAIIVDFLSGTFDCRISPMRLGTKSLTAAWERWVQDAGLPTKGPLAKDMVLTLGFYIPQAEVVEGDDEQQPEGLGIKSVDIIIPADKLRRFGDEGKTLAADGAAAKGKTLSQGYEGDLRTRKRLAGGKADEGWAWREGNEKQQPFLNAVAAYLDKHLALNLFHPGVRVTKIACGGFVLSEGRVKVFTPPGDDEVFEPVRNLVNDLVASAAG
ncbi:siroheme synthase [Colletotrichum plurivorum]|uniref:Siroheme synthase n=1 Tax=Colletotrichum plurivorum TaxID=2175906 RepID=A0A8H6N2D9_9PEZI|nr:siroheme synthase [Colletotrichum plurivorum]